MVGILIMLGLAVAYLESIDFSFRRIKADSLWIALGVLGPFAYMAFLFVKHGNPFEFSAAHNSVGWIAEMGLLPRGPMDCFQLIVLAVAAGLVIYSWRTESRATAAWATIMLLVSCTRWPSMARLSLVIFPLYVVAAQVLKNTKWFLAAVLISSLMLVALTLRFALWYWVA